jgi:hypothetical protein
VEIRFGAFGRSDGVFLSKLAEVALEAPPAGGIASE